MTYYDIETISPGLYDLVIRHPDRDEPEFVDRFDNRCRAWLAAKESAKQRGLPTGEAPWLRGVRLPVPGRRR